MIIEPFILLLVLLTVPLLGLISLPYLVERTAKLELIPIENASDETYQSAKLR